MFREENIVWKMKLLDLQTPSLYSFCTVQNDCKLIAISTELHDVALIHLPESNYTSHLKICSM